jgi:hypothetical protein
VFADVPGFLRFFTFAIRTLKVKDGRFPKDGESSGRNATWLRDWGVGSSPLKVSRC